MLSQQPLRPEAEELGAVLSGEPLSLLVISSFLEKTALGASTRSQCLLVSAANDAKGVIHTEAGNGMPARAPEHLGFRSLSPKARAPVSSPGCQ